MKRRMRIFLFLILAVFIVLFVGMSGFTGLQVFAGSTQLVTNEHTMGISDGFWENHGIDEESLRRQYLEEEIAIPFSFEEHTIPADYIHAVESSDNKHYEIWRDYNQEYRNKMESFLTDYGGEEGTKRTSRIPIKGFGLPFLWFSKPCRQNPIDEAMA